MSNPADYEEHPGPLRKGDLIVLQVHKWLLPHVSDQSRPQGFVVLEDQHDKEPVALRHVAHAQPGVFRRYVCGWRPSEFADRLQAA